MRVIQRTVQSDIANVFIGENVRGRRFEFVESVQPPLTRDQKWVLIISTMFGYPVGCSFCDAGVYYQGKLTYEELLFQIDYLIRLYYGDKKVSSSKFKIQFSRMGEPSFNSKVLKLLKDLPFIYDIPGFTPSLSSIAPHGTDQFFRELLQLKKYLYRNTFQLQFSMHSTDETQRNKLIPVRKWDFGKIAEYGTGFYDKGGKKVTLNFALSTQSIISASKLKEYFDPDIFLIKLTPINPTFSSRKNKIHSALTGTNESQLKTTQFKFDFIPNLISSLNEQGYEVIISIGEKEENRIGSNCGQFIQTLFKEETRHEESYCYPIIDIGE